MGNGQLCEHGLDLVEASVQGLPPVVYYINIGTIITWFIEPLHCHCLRISTKLLSLHFDIGVLTGQVCPGGETSHASRDGECLTSIKQFVEMLASGRSWRTAPNFIRHLSVAASVPGPQWQTAKPTSASPSHKSTVSPRCWACVALSSRPTSNPS